MYQCNHTTNGMRKSSTWPPEISYHYTPMKIVDFLLFCFLTHSDQEAFHELEINLNYDLHSGISKNLIPSGLKPLIHFLYLFLKCV